MYRPDHTAHIRAELARSRCTSRPGWSSPPRRPGATLLIGQVTDLSAAPGWLIRALWIVGAFAVTVSLVGLATVLVRWLAYLRRRAELDAAGAEHIGEINARLVNRSPEP